VVTEVDGQTSGSTFWAKSARARAQVVRRVCENLEETYGKPRLGNPEDPLDDLVYVLLSNKTPPVRARAVYERLIKRFPTWAEVAEDDSSEVISLLKPAGFAVKRAGQIRASLEKVESDFGAYSLDALKNLSREDARSYLTSLPGVSDKVAKCVMMYTLDFDVLPVDVHVHRVARRLGWTTVDRPEQDQGGLEQVVPPKRRFSYHVGCVSHGRALCRATRPNCPPCPLKKHCEYFNIHLQTKAKVEGFSE
jgi:endonuclease III